MRKYIEQKDTNGVFNSVKGRVQYFMKQTKRLYERIDINLESNIYIGDVSQFIIPNDTIYFWDSLVDVFNSQQRNIVVSDTDLEVPSLNREFNVDNGLGNVAAVCIPEIVGEANFLKSGAKGNTFIYSSRTAETFGGAILADFIFKYNYTVTCYDGVDENAVKSAIQSALAYRFFKD